jgi:hydroxymethylglutaryl-CoA lyase
LSELVKIIECPRDAWQALPKIMLPEVKAEYLRALVAAGFQHLDAVSFVSKSAVPQMADSEFVLEYLDAPEEVEIIGIVVNAKGAERAVDSGRVTTIGFPYSISPQFLDRNQRQTPEEALDQLEQIGEIAYKGGQDVVAYLSMAFGNPYGDVWDIDEVVSAVDLLVDSGVAQVSLADTVGLASPELIRDVMRLVLDVHEGLEVGIHLHARLRGRLPTLRLRHRRHGRLPLRAGRPGWQHPHRAPARNPQRPWRRAARVRTARPPHRQQRRDCETLRSGRPIAHSLTLATKRSLTCARLCDVDCTC